MPLASLCPSKGAPLRAQHTLYPHMIHVAHLSPLSSNRSALESRSRALPPSGAAAPGATTTSPGSSPAAACRQAFRSNLFSLTASSPVVPAARPSEEILLYWVQSRRRLPPGHWKKF